MPELPEVETVKNTLANLIVNAKIIDANVLYPNITTTGLSRCVNQSITRISRKGKFLIWHLNEGYIVIHLRMEGRFYILDEPSNSKHCHCIFKLDDGRYVNYIDSRKFGRLDYVSELSQHRGLTRLGFEIWDEQVTAVWFKNQCQKRTIAIKQLLLDQSVLCGIGNIYANEILFESKVHPDTPSNQLTLAQIKLILEKTKQVLQSAISWGGTTIDSFESNHHVTGLFQQFLKVHGRVNQPCLICGSKIEKKFINQRGTYYCPRCQKIKK